MDAFRFDLLEKISITVLDFLYKQTAYTAALFIIILAITFALRKKSPRWHLGLWLLVLVRLILPTNLFSSLSIRNLFDQFFNINKFTAPIKAIGGNTGSAQDK